MWIKKCSVERLVTRLGGLEKWKTRVLCCKRKENFCSNCDSYRKKVQSCLAECQCILGQVWCDEKTKHKKQQLPISQRRDNKKIWNSQGRVEKSQIKKSPMTSLLSQHFVQYSVIFIWGLFTYKVAKKSQKESEKKTKIEKIWPEVESCSGSHQDTSREIHHIVRVGRQEA